MFPATIHIQLGLPPADLTLLNKKNSMMVSSGTMTNRIDGLEKYDASDRAKTP
jgi:hypothetical protein